MITPVSASAVAATFETRKPDPVFDTVTLNVLIGMAHGRSYPEIAADHGLALRTVELRARVLREQLGASDRAGVVGAAYRRGLLPVEPSWSTLPVHTIPAVTMQATLDVLFLASTAYDDHEVREARELARVLINANYRRQVVPELPPMTCMDDLFPDATS